MLKKKSNTIRINLYIIFFISLIKADEIFYADPFYLILNEQKNYFSNDYTNSFLFRPLIKLSNKNKYNIYFRNEFFFNSGPPNLENMGNRWIGKGFGFFTSINLSFLNKYIIFTMEPFYIENQNKSFPIINRDSPDNNNSPDLFNVLNDNKSFKDSPYKKFGFRETSLFIHNKGIGLGFSNNNMWWGPGAHTSLTMTNNTTAFPYLMIGTLNDQKYKNLGINIRYIFSQLDKIEGKPYYTALIFLTKIFSEPIISIGFSRNYISGGLSIDRPFTLRDAMLLPFENLFIDTKINKYPEVWEAHDYWDQTISAFVVLDDRRSNIKLFVEIGTDDHRQNLMDLRSQPDHNSAIIFGLRKYGLFNNPFIFSGFEYANIKQSYTYKFRGGGHWWWKDFYNYSSYDGRRWAAHSGSDSDDFYLFFGYNSNNYTIIPSINYERHGIVFADKPEVKIELKLDIRFKFNLYYFNILYEYEYLNNLGFEENNFINNNIILLGIEKDLRSLFEK